jgi:hypothetical protein
MSDDVERTEGLTRKQAVGGAIAAGGGLALPGFLNPEPAMSASGRREAMALFLGQDELPVPPKTAKVHTSACQYCHVGCCY